MESLHGDEARVHRRVGEVVEILDEAETQNGQDKAVDGDGLAEDDADEILGLDARRVNAGPHDGRARDEDAPGRARAGEQRGRGGLARGWGFGPRTRRRRRPTW